MTPEDTIDMTSNIVGEARERPLSDCGLHALAEPDLDPMFWHAERLGAPSAWWEHVAFAHWVIAATRPDVLVELGTHAGVSYSAFCQAVVRLELPTRCHAVDTWQGDEHAGAYDDSVYTEFSRFNQEHFNEFSTLIRTTFDEALGVVEDRSVDLLHIDGLHTYEAVRHDYESWLPKLSDRAVVIFHDINERSGDFGVWKLWAELKAEHPSFSFLHGHGLGVVAPGMHVPEPVLALCRLENPGQVARVRTRFARLGERWLVDTRERMLGQHTGEIEALRQAVKARTAERAEMLERLTAIEQVAAERSEAQRVEMQARLTSVEQAAAERAEADARRVAASAARTAIARQEAIAAAETARALMAAGGQQTDGSALKLAADDVATAGIDHQQRAELEQLRRNLQAEIDTLRATLGAITGSTIWRASAPIRRVGSRLPLPARRGARGVVKLIMWSVTFQLFTKLRERRRLVRYYQDAAQAEKRHLPAPPQPAALAAIQMPQPMPAFVAAAAVDMLDRSSLRLVYVSGEPDSPGHVYRVQRHRDSLAELGARSSWMRVDEVPARTGEIEGATILVIWRAPWDDNVAAAIEAARRGGTKVVFDVDDLMIDPDIAKLDLIDGIRSQYLVESQVQEFYGRVRQTMLAADLCFTTTEELAFSMRWAGKTTFVLPNGFDQATHDLSRRSAREWRARRSDDLIRIGYAGGSRTHQLDFGLAVPGIARLLREEPRCRLVLFRTADGTLSLIDIEEYPELAGLEDRIEWRPLQPLANLPSELARFDINLAPLEFGNPFCEAKSELKFFEAALVDVPTVASPTGPFRRAIEHGKTGLLAATAFDWYVHLKQLADDPALRQRMAHNAYVAALATSGPVQRTTKFARVIDQALGGVGEATAFALEAHLSTQPWQAPKVFESDTVFERSAGGQAEVSVIVPLYNYENYVVEALDSVHGQTLSPLDLVIVDGFSTDNSLAVAKNWAEKNATRFNRIVVLQNRANYGLAFCRNSGFDAAQTAYVLPLDADNLLLPRCCEVLLQTIRRSGAAYVYPTIQHFGASSRLLSDAPYHAQRFVAGNYVDAMALVSKQAWAIIGGYDHVRHGWEDYDFWCRLAEHGLRGEWQTEVLARYRVHAASMMTAQTTVPGNYRRLVSNFKERHPWVSLIDQQTMRRVPRPVAQLPATESRLDRLLPILRCPVSHQKLTFDDDRAELCSVDGLHRWSVRNGRPVLSPGLDNPDVMPKHHISNDLPDIALDLIRDTKGLVLNLSAGGSRVKHEHVVEVEYAIFRHTDIVGDAHSLPFDDESFAAVIVMNAFEHYREPDKAAAELLRVLKPGGRILVRTAFMQPLHERPWHFYNCTRYGMAEWFKEFQTDRLSVSGNFCPNHSVAWLASEAETALRSEVSARSADQFMQAPIGALIEIWRDPGKRQVPLWTDFEQLSQTTQEITAAGFEFVGRKPLGLPDLSGGGKKINPSNEMAS